MDRFARRPRGEREEVFTETAAILGLGRAAIIEKDFWVCWTLLQLDELFGNEQARSPASPRVVTPRLLFKGGTSLSKVYGAIRRFSEDVDLTVDREALGFTISQDGLIERSQKQRHRILRELEDACGHFVGNSIAPLLRERLTDARGHRQDSPYHLRDEGVEWLAADPQTIHLRYPRSLSADAYPASAYVSAQVRLEFGARGAMRPAREASVTPYAAEQFPGAFTQPTARVRVLGLARTLWEKATILHEIAHTGRARAGSRLSRHYYDFFRLVDHVDGRAALANSELLAEVAKHKSSLFTRPAARYDLARPGTLRLLPSDDALTEIRRDYQEMREMFFEAPPSFEEIIEQLRALELQINSR